MKKIFQSMVAAMVLTFACSPTWAENVDLSWDAVNGATSYIIQRSDDFGVTWKPEDVREVPAAATTYVYEAVPETGLILFRAGAVRGAELAVVRLHSGAWYNYMLKPIGSPSGTGIK